MKVLAVDLSTTRTGWALGEPGKIETFGSFKRPAAMEDPDYLFYMAKNVAEKAIEGQVAYIAAEDWVRGPSATQMLRSGCLRGCVMQAVKEKGNLDCMFFPPSEWRKASGIDLTNLPKKNKRVILKQRAVTMCKGMGLDVKNDDEAEACLILKGLENLLEVGE